MLYADDIVLFAPSAKGLQKLECNKNLVSLTLIPERLVMRKV